MLANETKSVPRGVGMLIRPSSCPNEDRRLEYDWESIFIFEKITNLNIKENLYLTNLDRNCYLQFPDTCRILDNIIISSFYNLKLYIKNKVIDQIVNNI